MLKAIFENKDGGKLKKTVAEIGGQEVDRDHLLRMKAELTDRIARAADPAEAEEDAILLAQVNNFLDAMRKVDEAKAQAAERKRILDEQQRQQDLEAATTGQEIFLGHLKDICWPAIERLTALSERPMTAASARCSAGTPQEVLFRRAVNDYMAQLFEKLSYSDAEKQANEIKAAAREKRDWRLLVHLPAPRTTIEELERVKISMRRPGQIAPSGSMIPVPVFNDRRFEDENFV